MNDPRFPIGRFAWPEQVNPSDLLPAISVIERAPRQFRAAVEGWSDERLDTPYREGGWTVRQLLHHVPESHMNSFIRFKLALTEAEPTIKPYAEDEWAKLPDAIAGPIEPSLRLLESLHECWTYLLRSMTPEQWQRTFRHPERGLMRLDVTALLYAWHCDHHLAHITGLRDRMGW
ncbi:MAG TPA: putative metal-dependent hydrolase [Bryobacteraceae bacterium]|nr:putative metal-dependent hydrolase [Bryobacteraceae bacterium]